MIDKVKCHVRDDWQWMLVVLPIVFIVALVGAGWIGGITYDKYGPQQIATYKGSSVVLVPNKNSILDLKIELDKAKFCPSILYRVAWRWRDRSTGEWIGALDQDPSAPPTSNAEQVVVHFDDDGPLPLVGLGHHVVHDLLRLDSRFSPGRWHYQATAFDLCKGIFGIWSVYVRKNTPVPFDVPAPGT